MLSLRRIVEVTLLAASLSARGFAHSPSLMLHFNTIPRSDRQIQLPITPATLESNVPQGLSLQPKNDVHRYLVRSRGGTLEWTLHRMRVGSEIHARSTPRYAVVFENADDRRLAETLLSNEYFHSAEIGILSDLMEGVEASPKRVRANHLVIETPEGKLIWLGSVLRYATLLVKNGKNDFRALSAAWADIIQSTPLPGPLVYERCDWSLLDVPPELPGGDTQVVDEPSDL